MGRLCLLRTSFSWFQYQFCLSGLQLFLFCLRLLWFVHLCARIFPTQHSGLCSGLGEHCNGSSKRWSQTWCLGFCLRGYCCWIWCCLILFLKPSVSLPLVSVLFLFRKAGLRHLCFWHLRFLLDVASQPCWRVVRLSFSEELELQP